MKKIIFGILFCPLAFLSLPAFSAPKSSKKVCVEVLLKDLSGHEEVKADVAEVKNPEEAEPEETAPWPLKKKKHRQNKKEVIEHIVTYGNFLPIGQTPEVYLKRLIEHFVTHNPGHEAADTDCQETIRAELYPLAEGWTVFTRYSENGREERVDQLRATELSQFAERAVTALLNDVPISATILRDTVLTSDSEKSVQRIKGTNHFVFGLGTQIRGGKFNTAQSDATLPAQPETRIFSPMMLSIGYRGKFENWGVEALTSIGIGTSKTAPAKNTGGGHIDLGGDFSVSLHFLRYTNPRGLTSFYLGAGSSFELLWFSAIAGSPGNEHSTLLSGGLDVDLLFGWEFMRASSVQFYLQGEFNIPAYVIDSEDNSGGIHTWFPCFTVKLGMVF